MSNVPSFQESQDSKPLALQLLQTLGYTYLSPREALTQRQGKTSNIILDDILKTQLKAINTIAYKGQTHNFSDANIENAVNALKTIPYDGLIRSNEKIYELLTLGKSLEQTLEGDTKSFTLQYIDWKNPKNNRFHVTEEFEVAKLGSGERRIPDLVLFVNGIPLVVIECKKREIGTYEAISQHIRNQSAEEIPQLFIYSQILLALSVSDAKYASTGTPAKFWSFWRERYFQESELQKKIGSRLVTEQDRALQSLCEPARLLELIFKFIVFDKPEKKIARYQQYNAVKQTLARIVEKDAQGWRPGGVIWHTQGSGKSLTMVMMAKAIALDPRISNPKIVIVTDRKELDTQIKDTFKNCDLDPKKASTGRHLSDLIANPKTEIITTVVNKFETALKNAVANDSADIFVLVDESHRSQYGRFNVSMQRVFPKACYLGFTGTPLMKSDKNTSDKFGGIIDRYTIDQAVQDKAVVPLLYEGRHVLQDLNPKMIDDWFERVSQDLTEEQKKDLKKKFSTANQLNKAEEKVKLIAYDISLHYSQIWKNTGFKAQLTAPDKATALKYKKYFDEFGEVSTEVLISGPDTREGYAEIYEEPTDEVQKFWKKMMEKYGCEEDYNKKIIEGFKDEDNPEIIIVVDKLLTGFDAPRNTVLYITRSLKDHTLLQAIARVNRLYEGKDYGHIIDYYGILGNLDKALTDYGALADFDEEDLSGTLLSIQTEVSKLAQRHSDLWEIFKTIKNKQDIEAFERFLIDESIRPEFYKRLSIFARTLGLALSTVKFIEETPPQEVDRYKQDLKFFSELRGSVKRRYSETVDFKEYEARIQKLLDSYVNATEIVKITDPVDIFDKEKFNQEVSKIVNPASKADTIAHRTQKTIHEHMEEDPAFYTRFSELLKKTIADWRQKRITETEYLARVIDIMESVRNRTGDDIPSQLSSKEVAKAFYGVTFESIKTRLSANEAQKIAADLAIKIDDMMQAHLKVDWVHDSNIINQMSNAIDDFLFDLKNSEALELSTEEMDAIIQKIIDIAKKRYGT